MADTHVKRELPYESGVVAFAMNDWVGELTDLDRWPEVHSPTMTMVIDGFGAHLTPGQVRTRIAEYQEMHEMTGVTVVLVTTNKVALDEVGVDKVYIKTDDGEIVAVTRCHERAFLSHFAVGDLYDREKLAPEEKP